MDLEVPMLAPMEEASLATQRPTEVPQEAEEEEAEDLVLQEPTKNEIIFVFLCTLFLHHF